MGSLPCRESRHTAHSSKRFRFTSVDAVAATGVAFSGPTPGLGPTTGFGPEPGLGPRLGPGAGTDAEMGVCTGPELGHAPGLSTGLGAGPGPGPGLGPGISKTATAAAVGDGAVVVVVTAAVGVDVVTVNAAPSIAPTSGSCFSRLSPSLSDGPLFSSSPTPFASILVPPLFSAIFSFLLLSPSDGARSHSKSSRARRRPRETAALIGWARCLVLDGC